MINKRYERFLEMLAELANLQNIGALLSWDQQVLLPRGAHGERGEQSSLVTRLVHERFTSAEMGDLLDELTDAVDRLPEDAVVNVRETHRLYEREKRLPAKLVEEMSRAFSQGYEAWLEAKQSADFSRFAPSLMRNVELQREAAAHYGYKREIYDALLDGNEQGMTAEQLEAIFTGLKTTIVRLVGESRSAGRFADEAPLRGNYPSNRQQTLTASLVAKLGFNLESGRIDAAPHPFTTQMGTHDVRLTSWYKENDPLVAIRATMHETGHGLYRQGFDPLQRGTPLGSIASKGIDEAQARFWENCIGKSRDFWEHFYPEFKAAFPQRDVWLDADQIVRRLNVVRPGTSRVHADEVTYNLHIILRFEIERDLLRGRVTVGELPELWNQRMRDDLGVAPADDSEGVLQDPHWSDSMFGYFPTYALGNVYAAQILAAVRRDVADFQPLLLRGEFSPILGWLREKIHRHGMRYQPAELIEKATGAVPSSEAFIQYLEHKYG